MLCKSTLSPGLYPDLCGRSHKTQGHATVVPKEAPWLVTQDVAYSCIPRVLLTLPLRANLNLLISSEVKSQDGGLALVWVQGEEVGGYHFPSQGQPRKQLSALRGEGPRTSRTSCPRERCRGVFPCGHPQGWHEAGAPLTRPPQRVPWVPRCPWVQEAEHGDKSGCRVGSRPTHLLDTTAHHLQNALPTSVPLTVHFTCPRSSVWSSATLDGARKLFFRGDEP